jgi:hypothetical protein
MDWERWLQAFCSKGSSAVKLRNQIAKLCFRSSLLSDPPADVDLQSQIVEKATIYISQRQLMRKELHSLPMETAI